MLPLARRQLRNHRIYAARWLRYDSSRRPVPDAITRATVQRDSGDFGTARNSHELLHAGNTDDFGKADRRCGNVSRSRSKSLGHASHRLLPRRRLATVPAKELSERQSRLGCRLPHIYAVLALENDARSHARPVYECARIDRAVLSATMSRYRRLDMHVERRAAMGRRSGITRV